MDEQQKSEQAVDLAPTVQSRSDENPVTLGIPPKQMAVEAIVSGEQQNVLGNVAEDIASLEELKKEKIRLEHTLFLTNEELDAVREKLHKTSELYELQKKDNESMLRERGQRMASMRELEAERDRFLLAKNEAEQKAEILLRQKEDYNAKVVRLEHDKSLQSMDIQMLKDEIKKLTERNCQIATDYDEAMKEKRLIQYERERWEQEKEIFLKNKEWFMNEIKERDRKYAGLRIEMIRYTGDLQAKAASALDECERSKTEIDSLKSQVADRDAELAKVNKRLKEVFEETAQKVNKLEQELLASERLSTVYKEASEEAEKHFTELREDFEARGKLLDESKIAYETLLSKIDDRQKQFDEDLNEKDKRISDLLEELEKANELIKSSHQQLLTNDEAIHALSPAASVAASLLRNGKSLTEIYKEHCRAISELEEVKAENKRLGSYFNELVEDIEKKAPLLAQQRIDHERTLELCNNLQKQLKVVNEERQKLENARDAAVRELVFTRAELERYQRDNADLSKQARHLLHIMETSKALDEDAELSTEEKDLLWASIGDLQRANQKLMSDLRTANANREKEMEQANTTEITRLKTLLNEALNKVELLKTEHSKQNLIIAEIGRQRDIYKSVGEAKKSEEEVLLLTKQIHEYEIEISTLRTRAERAEKSLELFCEEKQRSDQILQERIEHQSSLVAELRTTNGKLEADLELQKQTQSMLTKQTESDINELNLAKEKCTKLQANYDATVSRCTCLQEELMETKAEVAKYKTDVESLYEKLTLLKSSEARLLEEVKILRDTSFTNEKLAQTINQLQSRMEHSEEERVNNLNDQLTLLRNENETLKEFVNEVAEQHRIISLDLKMTTNKIQTERDQALASKKSAEDRLSWKEKELIELQSKYDELINQLNSPDSNLDTTVEGCKKEAQQLRNRNSYLENQLRDMSNKFEACEKKLLIREQQLAEITSMSNNLESALLEQNACTAAEQKSQKAMLELVQTQLAESVATIEEKRAEIARLENRVAEEVKNAQEAKLNAQRELAELAKKYNHVEALKVNAEVRVDELGAALEKIKNDLKLEELKYKKQTEEVKTLELSIYAKDTEVSNLKSAVSSAEDRLNALRKSTSSEIAMYRLEKTKLEQALSETNLTVEEQRKKLEALNDSLVKLTERAAFLEHINVGRKDEQVGPSLSNPVQEIIKYLQTENRQAAEKAMEAELQWKRLQAQQSTADEYRQKLESELCELRKERESIVRMAAERSEMVARLSLMDGIKKENQALKNNSEENKRRCERLTNDLTAMQNRVNNLQAERTAEKSQLQNAVSDLEICQKELEVWKERHAHSMSTLSKSGPDHLAVMTNEMETLRRKLNLITVERDSLKKGLERIAQGTQSSASASADELDDMKKKLEEAREESKNLKARFEQARALARQYRMKFQNLEKEYHALKGAQVEKAFPQEEGNSNEINKLRAELQVAQAENERLQTVTSRTGWPSETSSSQAKANSLIIQTQMKQLENLTAQNKELNVQLGDMSGKLKDFQEKLAEVENQNKVLREESDNREELHFRLNSITSLMTKKDQEITRLNQELQSSRTQREDSMARVNELEAELQSIQQRAETSLVDPTLKSASVSTSLASLSGSVGGAPGVIETLSEVQGGGQSAEFSASAASTLPLPLGVSASALTTAVETEAESSQKEVPTAQKVISANQQNIPVSTTSEQVAVASSSRRSTSPSVQRLPEIIATSSPKRAEVQRSNVAGIATAFSQQTYCTQTAPQSNAVSQSSAPTSFASNAGATAVQSKPAQHNVISGSGDNLSTSNVTSSVPSKNVASSNVSHAASHLVTVSSQEKPAGCITSSRKRTYVSFNEQASSVETESEVQGSSKRIRGSPSEQVSTSGRYMRTGSDAQADEDRLCIVDDEAEQEQQDNVETTTNMEETEQQTLASTPRAAIADEVAQQGAEMVDVASEAAGGAHAASSDLQLEAASGDELARDASADEDNNDLPGDGSLEDVEEEDYDEEEGFDDEEEDFEEGYVFPNRYAASRPTNQGTDNDNDDGGDGDVVFLGHDDDDDEGAEQSRSPAEQTTDEAHSATSCSLQTETSGRVGEVYDEMIAGQAETDASERQSSVTLRVIDESKSQFDERIGSEPSADLEFGRSQTICEGGNVVSGSESQGLHRSPPFIENTETDSRGPSSTMTSGTDLDTGDNERVLMMVAIEGELGNEVAEEEQDLRKNTLPTAQTDDEMGSSEPTTSDAASRRIRIRIPDIGEPTSSSSEPVVHPVSSVSQRVPHARRGRRGRGYRYM